MRVIIVNLLSKPLRTRKEKPAMQVYTMPSGTTLVVEGRPEDALIHAYYMTEGRIPVTRTVASPPTIIRQAATRPARNRSFVPHSQPVVNGM